MRRFTLLRGASAGALALVVASTYSSAQEVLATIDIGQRSPSVAPGPPSDGPSVAGVPGEPAPGQGGSLTVPPVAEQRREVFQTAGSVDFVDSNTPEIQTCHIANLTDALKDVPGVFAETRYGQEIRLPFSAIFFSILFPAIRKKIIAGSIQRLACCSSPRQTFNSSRI